MMLIVIHLLGVSGCSVSQNADVGETIGVIAGGYIGSAIGQGTGRIAAITLGAVIGGITGWLLGNAMDTTDRTRIYQALYYNQTNEASRWLNPYTGFSYIAIPTSDLLVVDDIPECRTYKIIKNYKGCPQRIITGLACMRMDSTWELGTWIT